MIKMTDFLKKIKLSSVVKAMVPIEYGMGLPTISICNDELLVHIPFFKEEYRPKDQSLVFPFAYVVSAIWDSGKITEVYRTEYSDRFCGLLVNQPVGTFRHKAIQNLNKGEYLTLKEKLYELYDEVIKALTSEMEYTQAMEKEFQELLNRMMEPSLKQCYRLLDNEFYERFLSIDDWKED